MNDIIIRNMIESDKDFIIDLSARLADIEYMDWRDRQKMKDAQRKMAQEAISNRDQDSDIFVVEDGNKTLLGYLYITKITDFFTGVEQGYISSIAITKEGEGKGIGKKLIEKAEEWTKNKGYKQLSLNVFKCNERAVNFYTKLNFETETMRMVKELD